MGENAVTYVQQAINVPVPADWGCLGLSKQHDHASMQAQTGWAGILSMVMHSYRCSQAVRGGKQADNIILAGPQGQRTQHMPLSRATCAHATSYPHAIMIVHRRHGLLWLEAGELNSMQQCSCHTACHTGSQQ
jgi:hypothetical protein